MNKKIVLADEHDVVLTATLARDVDREEAYYQTGLEIEDAAIEAFDASNDRVWAGYYNDEPVCCFGVALVSPLYAMGAPWMIATPLLDKVKVSFAAGCCYYRNEIRQGFDVLQNVVWAENKPAIRWLKWMGFEVGEAAAYGPFDKPFHPFEWRK